MPDIEQILVIGAMFMSLFSMFKWGFVDGRVDELRDEIRDLKRQLEELKGGDSDGT